MQWNADDYDERLIVKRRANYFSRIIQKILLNHNDQRYQRSISISESASTEWLQNRFVLCIAFNLIQ